MMGASECSINPGRMSLHQVRFLVSVLLACKRGAGDAMRSPQAEHNGGQTSMKSPVFTIYKNEKIIPPQRSMRFVLRASEMI